MRRVLLSGLALVVLGSSTAWASDNWVVYKGQGSAWAYDAGELVANTDKGIAIATYATYAAAGGNLSGTAYHFAVTKSVFNCSAESVRIGEVSLYDNNGKLIRTLAATSTAQARPVISPDVDQISKLLFGVGCAGAFPPAGAVQATGLANALQRMKS